MIKLYQFDVSPFCDKVRRILNVKGLDYEIEEVSIASTRRVARRLNQTNKLPAIEHDGLTVTDSTDIAWYLEKHFPQPRLIPSDPIQKARVHVLEDWADESLYFYEMTMRFAWPNNAKHWAPILLKNDSAPLRAFGSALIPRALKKVAGAQGTARKTKEQVITDMLRHIDAIAGMLEDSDWLVGQELTLADIAVFCQLFCINGTEEGRELISERSSVAAWFERTLSATAGN